jgi:ribosome-binding protein aMBF1 (putative translation factor)
MSEFWASDLHKKWMKHDPDYVREYKALEEEFSLASAMIAARTQAGLTQGQLAKRMKTTRAVVARLESGRVKPSTRTLERFAKATSVQVRISFEPIKAHRSAA